VTNSVFNNSSDIREPLLPVVQLKFGSEDFIVTVPPNNLQEFTSVIRAGSGADMSSFVFIDPTYGEIEKQIFLTDKNAKPLLYRWGYPGNGLERAQWSRMSIRTYLPTITHAGLRITIECVAVGSEFAYIVEPATYKGKISSVAKAIAKEMKFSSDQTFIEETDDDVNEERNQEWFAANQTRIDLLMQLVGLARSKANPSEVYEFRLDAEGNFHFHTKQYKLPGMMFSADQTYRQFRVLFGHPTGVSSFTPRYEANQFSPLASSIVASTLDPKTKRYMQRVLTRDNLGLSDKQLDDKSANSARTTAGPLVQSSDQIDQRRKANAHVFQPTQQIALGGRCSGKTTQVYAGPEAALTKTENFYKIMQNMMYGASMELVGLPEYADFRPNELYCDVLVVLPAEAAALSRQNLHWSSGRYAIREMTHHISSAYVISVELFRSFALEGTSTAKVKSPERQAQLLEVTVK